jgi:predicted CXXCH cytochrome family protein
MHPTLRHFLTALAFAFVTAALTLVIAQAQTATPISPSGTTSSSENCANCHKDIYDSWQVGPHGQAMSDPVFNTAWESQGKPGACLVCHSTGYDPVTQSMTSSVTCTACHNPMSIDHPKQPAPVDSTPALCGKCHSDPRFSTGDWMMSAHYQRGMSCTTCHDPHKASFKLMPNAPADDDGSALCANCHKDAMQNFPLSAHAKAGVTCVDCHLGLGNPNSTTTTTDFAAAHKAPDHSFTPTLDTCTKCHSTQMHGTGDAVAAAAFKTEQLGGTPTPEPTVVVTPVPQVTSTPTPVNPLGFAIVFGMLGLAGGMVLAPWLDRAYKRFIEKDGDK